MTTGIPEVIVRLVDGPRRLGDYEVYNADEAYRLLANELRDADRETLIVLCLDACLRPINYNIVAIGSFRQLQMPIANVFKVAILSNAAFIILAHNHPSGDPEPSDEDIENTRRVKEIGEILGIPLLEHIVIGNDGFVSMYIRM